MDQILADIIQSTEMVDHLRDLLVEICQIDTTPHPDPSVMRTREAEVFDIIERELARCTFAAARMERRPIDPDICRHAAYSPLHFTKTAERPQGLAPEVAYAGRGNLLFCVDGTRQSDHGTDVAINAHIDVVAPFFPPRIEGDIVFGRGACDDKGNVVAMIGALQVLSRYLTQRGLRLNRNVTGMIVIEEETGGNGSLSLALDDELKSRYDALLVLECCDNRIYPANRGAVWYRYDVVMPGVSQLEMACFVIEQLEIEGYAIRTESRHRLFPQRPVQTCHGMIDHFGEHPSRICGYVAFRVDFLTQPTAEVETLIGDCLDAAVLQYCGQYGDKTREIDSATGEPKVRQHFDLCRDDKGFVIEVHGATGHMGAIHERDGAITKMATMVRALVMSRHKLASLAGSAATMELVDRNDHEKLKLEGGQGFVPTHEIDEIMERMLVAARRGADIYLACIGGSGSGHAAIRGSYEKLHNAAYDGDPDTPEMQLAVSIARRLQLWPDDRPVTGWTVSCDARLFANQHAGLPVLTCGTGKLSHAHSDQEQVNMTELVRFVGFLAEYLLHITGTVTDEV